MSGPTIVTVMLILALLGGFLIGISTKDDDQ